MANFKEGTVIHERLPLVCPCGKPLELIHYTGSLGSTIGIGCPGCPESPLVFESIDSVSVNMAVSRVLRTVGTLLREGRFTKDRYKEEVVRMLWPLKHE